MRLLMPALLMPLIAACGSSEPPGVEFERPVSSVYNTLAAVDGRVDMEGLLKTPAVSRQQAANNSLVFVLGADSAEHNGTVTFRFEPIDAKRSRVIVDAEIPEVEAKIDGQTKYLSESKIERVLARQLNALARKMKAGGMPITELDELDQAIAFTALALDPKEIARALELAGNSGALAAAMERQLAWGADDTGDWATVGDATDDTYGAEASGNEALGMDAAGTDASGTDSYGDAAMGDALEYDSAYGQPDE